MFLARQEICAGFFITFYESKKGRNNRPLKRCFVPSNKGHLQQMFTANIQ